MQIQAGVNTVPGAKTPPTPQIQTPIGGSHSRSSSHASASSQLSKVDSEAKVVKDNVDIKVNSMVEKKEPQQTEIEEPSKP